jgi:hypothetical protein
MIALVSRCCSTAAATTAAAAATAAAVTTATVNFAFVASFGCDLNGLLVIVTN